MSSYDKIVAVLAVLACCWSMILCFLALLHIAISQEHFYFLGGDNVVEAPLPIERIHDYGREMGLFEEGSRYGSGVTYRGVMGARIIRRFHNPRYSKPLHPYKEESSYFGFNLF